MKGGGYTLTWIIENFINFITRFSVPCFVMLSGAFNLHGARTLDYKAFYRKSFFKIVIPFLIIYFIWMLAYGMKALLTGDAIHYIGTILKGTYGNLWFMPMLISLYVISPLIVKLKGNKRIPLSIGVILLIWAIISQSTSEYEIPYSIGVIFSYLSYYLMGNILYESKRNLSIVVSVLGIIFVALIAIWWRCANHQFYSMEYYRAFFSPLVVIMSVLVFMVFKQISIKNKLIEWLSGKSFYVYLLHTPVLIIVRYVFDQTEMAELSKIIIEIAVVSVFSFLLAIFYEKIIRLFVDVIRQLVNAE